MPFFCISDHPKLPLVRADIHKKAPTHDKDGFRLRYSAPINESAVEGAKQVIEMLDEAMGKATRAPGVYQAPYEGVRAAYGDIVGSFAPPPDRTRAVLRWSALLLAGALAMGSAALLSMATLCWLFFSAFQKRSGFAAMAEASILWSLLDWRPTIHKLVRYWRTHEKT